MSNVEPVRALNLDAEQQQSFVRYYRSLPDKPAGTIRFFYRSDYYTVHGEDATYAANELFGLQTIKYMGDVPKLSYLVLSRTNFEKFVRDLLLVKQYRVEVYVKATDSKNNDWSLEYKGSPGNTTQFDQLLFDHCEITFSTGVLAVNICKNKMIAASYVNITEAQMLVTEFSDNELFTELEALIAHISPKECIIPSGESPELTTLNSMLERNGILVAKVKKTQFNSADIEQDLNRLLYFYKDDQRNALTLSETNLTEAMNCLQVVIKDLHLISDEECYNHFKLSRFDVSRFVHIDNLAMTALNAFPKSGYLQRSNKSMCLLGVLDECCTQQGRRLLDQWLRQPLRDINIIRERLEVVDALVHNTEVRHMLTTNNLTRVPDLLMITKKLRGKKINLQDCYRIYQTISNVAPIATILGRCDNKYVKSVLIEPLSDLLVDCDKFQQMIEQIIDLDLVDRGEYFIKSSYKEELQVLGNKKIVLEEKMQKTLKRAANELGLESGKSIKLDCSEQHGYCFKVTLKVEPILRKNNSFSMVSTLKSGVRFTNRELTELNEDYAENNKNYEEEQKSVVKEIFDVAVGYGPTFRTLNMCIAKIDVFVSLANVAANAPIPFTKPKMFEEGSGILKLKKVRHPCLEVQDGVTFIANDVEFRKGEKIFYIITGPNMGGKSTYIRSIGITVLLAHIGSFVPCAEAEISVVDCILARIGANDSQIKGLSTFTLEMVETASIVKSATNKSLVIIDELGRGTSTYDGCGIAWSIVEHLAVNTQCFSLFATHFHEITQLPEKYPEIRNVHVSAVTTERTITPLYQVKEGPCDKSYGIHCARMAGFPSDVLNLASGYQKELECSQGMQFITDYETSLKRKVIEEGDLIITEFLTKCKNISHLSDQEVIEEVNKYKNELPRDNMFINGFLEN